MAYSDYFNRGSDPTWDDEALIQLMAANPSEAITIGDAANALKWDYFRARESINRLRNARKIGLNNKLLTGDEPERIGLKVHHKSDPNRHGEIIAELPNDKVRVRWATGGVAVYQWVNLVVLRESQAKTTRPLTEAERLEIEIQKLKDSARHQALRKANEIESDHHAQKTKGWRKILAAFEQQELSKREAQIQRLERKIERLRRGWKAGDEFIEGSRRGRLIKKIESKQVKKAWLAEFNGLKCIVSENFISPLPTEASGQLLLFSPPEEPDDEAPDPDDFNNYQDYERAIAIWEQKHPELASMLTDKNPCMDAEDISRAIPEIVENSQATTIKRLGVIDPVDSAIATRSHMVDNPLTIESDSPKTEVLTITLWQPWATFIAKGIKQIETRSWPTNYTGRILIHAAKRPINWDEIELSELEKKYPDIAQWDYPLGAIVAEAKLVGCEKSSSLIGSLSETEKLCGNYSSGRYGWKLENIKPLLIDNVSGKQGLWKFKLDAVTELEVCSKGVTKIPPVENWGTGTLFEINQQMKGVEKSRYYWIEVIGEIENGLTLKFFLDFNNPVMDVSFSQIQKDILDKPEAKRLILFRFVKRSTPLEPQVKPEIKPEIKKRKCAAKGQGSGYIKMREANKKRNAEKGKPPSYYYLWYYSFTDQFGKEYKRSCYLKNSQVEHVQVMIDSHRPYTEILKWLKK